jgi:hypothetical protein
MDHKKLMGCAVFWPVMVAKPSRVRLASSPIESFRSPGHATRLHPRGTLQYAVLQVRLTGPDASHCTTIYVFICRALTCHSSGA